LGDNESAIAALRQSADAFDRAGYVAGVAQARTIVGDAIRRFIAGLQLEA
jgi:hypothetical protein